ncbi:hypothetical protein ACU9D5_001918 [Cronobacter dublinensis]|jgi:hypothetical protein|uniref:hypothetical protein n=1 Tax=Cronobacter dublinensis TaxID=413497 RepID=UPI001319D566|nr:hypothetical protein [Cronobacter dublinensis]NHV90477.1 hypothetical protein [Cronobacter dublinensis]
MREDNIGLKSGKKKEQCAALNKGFCFYRLLYVSPECAVLFYLILFYAYISRREFNISMWRSNNILKRNWRKVKQGLICM